MKKLLFMLFVMTGTANAAIEVKEVARSFTVSQVSVSTTTVTAIPTTAFSGRYKVILKNTDLNFAIWIGSHSAVSTSTGYRVDPSTSPLSVITLPFNSGTAIYGIGDANGTRGTLTIDLIEMR